jgi:hypothetical protein
MLQRVQIVLLFLFIGVYSISQVDRKTEKETNLFVLLGGAYSSFQAVDLSSVRYSGFGVSSQIGYERNTFKNHFSVTTGLSFIIEKPSTFDVVNERGLSRIIYPNIQARYLRKISRKLSIGGRLDVLDFYYRTTQGYLFGNNEMYTQNGYNLALSAKYEFSLNTKFRFSFLLDFLLLKYQRSSKSFAFAAPQTALEQGAFNYQDEALTNPFYLKFHEFLPGWSSVDIRTAFKLSYLNRWSFNYFWQLRSNSTVKGYPTTFGIHQLAVSYNIINRTKENKSKSQLNEAL